MPNLQAVMQSMVSSVRSTPAQSKKGADLPVVVTISRDHGSSGREIGEKLAAKLGVAFYDHEFVEKLAERLNTDQQTIEALDEGVGRTRDLWLMRLVTGLDISPGTYRRHLVNVTLSLASMGGVIMGRGAHVVLDQGTALRVRITGSEDICAARIAERRNLSADEAVAQVKKVNKFRGKFVWDTFKSRLNDPSNFDICINTDRLSNVEHTVETLAAAIKTAQYSYDDREEAKASAN